MLILGLIVLFVIYCFLKGWFYIGEDDVKYQKAWVAIKLLPEDK